MNKHRVGLFNLFWNIELIMIHSIKKKSYSSEMLAVDFLTYLKWKGRHTLKTWYPMSLTAEVVQRKCVSQDLSYVIVQHQPRHCIASFLIQIYITSPNSMSFPMNIRPLSVFFLSDKCIQGVSIFSLRGISWFGKYFSVVMVSEHFLTF